MSNLPEISNLPPSAAKAAITDYYYQKLLKAELNGYGNPIYNLADALGDARDYNSEDFGGSGLIIFCFEQAEARYNTNHPRYWDPEKRIMVRTSSK